MTKPKTLHVVLALSGLLIAVLPTAIGWYIKSTTEPTYTITFKEVLPATTPTPNNKGCYNAAVARLLNLTSTPPTGKFVFISTDLEKDWQLEMKTKKSGTTITADQTGLSDKLDHCNKLLDIPIGAETGVHLILKDKSGQEKLVGQITGQPRWIAITSRPLQIDYGLAGQQGRQTIK